MRLPLLATVLTAATLASTATAQVRVFGEPGLRRTTSQVLFGDGITAGISIDHGQPVWKDEYDGMLDQLKGKLLRLGSNWWTTMTTSVPLNFGNTRIPAGAYLLGLQCDNDGNFSLTFLEATKGMRAGAMPFEIDGKMNWKPDYTATLKLRKDVATNVVTKMRMTLKIKPDQTGTYSLAWGKHRLHTWVRVAKKGGGKKEAAKKAGDQKGK